MNYNTYLSSSLRNDIDSIKNLFSPYSLRIYLVGGCVRDMFLGRSPHDIDIEVYGIAPLLFEQLMQRIKAQGVGKSFFVYKWKNFDIALARIEQKTGSGHKAFSVTVCDNEEEGSRRRDFTMNALMINLFSGEIYDFWNGRADIEQKIVRMIDASTFAEDSLRILRGAAFSVRFGFRIDASTAHLCQSLSINDLSKERVWNELDKLFHGANLAWAPYAFHWTGLDKKLFDRQFSKSECFCIALAINRALRYTHKDIHEKLPLFWIVTITKIAAFPFLKRWGAPKEFHRYFFHLPRVPQKVTLRFLCAIAQRRALNKWAGLYKKVYKDEAERLFCYEQPLMLPFGSGEAIALGLKGKEVGRWLINKSLDYLRECDKKIL